MILSIHLILVDVNRIIVIILRSSSPQIILPRLQQFPLVHSVDCEGTYCWCIWTNSHLLLNDGDCYVDGEEFTSGRTDTPVEVNGRYENIHDASRSSSNGKTLFIFFWGIQLFLLMCSLGICIFVYISGIQTLWTWKHNRWYSKNNMKTYVFFLLIDILGYAWMGLSVNISLLSWD